MSSYLTKSYLGAKLVPCTRAGHEAAATTKSETAADWHLDNTAAAEAAGRWHQDRIN